MSNQTVLAIAAALIGVSLSPPVTAHHSYINSPFDPCRSKSIEGEIQAVAWKAPHVWFTVKLDNAAVYEIEWVGLVNLVAEGVEAVDLPVGGRIVVTGSPHPSQNVISLLTEVRVLNADLNWSRPRPMMVRSSQSCSAAPQ